MESLSLYKHINTIIQSMCRQTLKQLLEEAIFLLCVNNKYNTDRCLYYLNLYESTYLHKNDNLCLCSCSSLL